MDLKDYIKKYFDGNRTAFASANGTTKQMVYKWIKGNYIIVDDKLYSPRREIKTQQTPDSGHN